MFEPGYRGILPWRGVDESQYAVRLERALLDPWHADTNNGFWPGPGAAEGGYFGYMEHAVGFLLSWTGWNAVWVSLLVSALLSPLAIPLVVALARYYTSSRAVALLASIIYYVCMGFLRRPFHPAWSAPLVVAALVSLHWWWRKPTYRSAVVAGVLLAGLVYTSYVWAWSFGWCVAAVLLLCLGVTRKSECFAVRLRSGTVGVGLALAVALPAFWSSFQVTHSALYAAVADRTEILATRAIESPIRSVMTLIVAASVVWYVGRRRLLWDRYMTLVAMTIASVLVLNQQLITGHVFSFSTHYNFYIALVCTLVIVAFVEQRAMQPAPLIVAAVAAVFVLAGVPDYSGRLDVLAAPPVDAMQY